MTIVLTEAGMKSWPLAGLRQGSFELPKSSTVDLIGLNLSATYAQMWQHQPWINTLVTKLARGVARLPLKTFQLDADSGEREHERDHPVADLIRRPWPRASAFSLKEAVVGSLAIYGHSLCVKYREQGPGSPPTELWPVNWQNVAVMASEEEPIAYYEYRGLTDRRIFLPDDVVHFQWWGPEGLGVSPMEPLRRTLAMEEAAQRYGINSFANAARPSGVIRTDQSIAKTDRDSMRADIEATYSGVDNAFRVALLTHGLEWQPTGSSAVEAEVIAQRKLNREEVCAVYDVPPPMVHILDRATFSNIDEQHRMWYQDTLGPWLTMIEEAMGAQLIEPEPVFHPVFIEFDLDEVLKGDAEKRSAAAQRWFQTGTLTPNELRRSENRPPVGEMDDPSNPANHVYIPAGMIPVSGEARPLSPDGEPEPEPEAIELRRSIAALASLMTLKEMQRNGSNGDGEHSGLLPVLLKALAARPAPAEGAGQQVVIRADKLEQVVHETHPVESHEHREELAPGAVKAEVEEGMQVAIASLRDELKHTSASRRFEYDERGLVKAIVLTDEDGGETRYAAIRDAESKLVELSREA